MRNFDSRLYDNSGLDWNIWETAKVEIQATLCMKGDPLFMYSNCTTKFNVAFFMKGFYALRYCNNDNAIEKYLIVVETLFISLK
jgi:hypothetical protein